MLQKCYLFIDVIAGQGTIIPTAPFLGPTAEPNDFSVFPAGINDNPLEFNMNKNKPITSR